MANSDRFQINGTIIESLKGGQFKVKLENGAECVGTIAGKLRVNSIRLIPGDEVQVDISPYDITKCRIIYRERNTIVNMDSNFKKKK